MQKNYYVILGVGSGATLEEIKSAFRRRALELHPDRAGLGDRPFQELQEAYGVLSDPQRRHNYDARRQPLAVRPHPCGPPAEPLVNRRVEAEPFSQPDVGRPVPPQKKWRVCLRTIGWSGLTRTVMASRISI